MQPVDVVVSGVALNAEGFIGLNYSQAGLGLNTFGFLWPCDGIWVNMELPITTTWTECSGTGSATIETCTD